MMKADGKHPASKPASMHGTARAQSLTREERRQIAKAAADARWSAQQVVYVIGPDAGPQKIGVALKPHVRMKELQTGNPAQLRVHHAVDVGEFAARDVEGRAHWLLRDQQLVGEWFNISPADGELAIKRAIDDLKRGGARLAAEAGPKTLVSVRLPTALLERIDGWAKDHGCSRTEALERLADRGLEPSPIARPPMVSSNNAVDRAPPINGRMSTPVDPLTGQPLPERKPYQKGGKK